MLTSVKHWLWLTSLLPPAAAWRVYRHFGSPERAYFSDPGEYRRIEGLSAAQCRLLEEKSVSLAEQILDRCDRQGIRVLTFSDTDYPERLRNIEVPPLVLYLRGRLLRIDDLAVVAFAGTRRATPYGEKNARDFASQITQGGGVVATGVVKGCDGCAVQGALSAGGPVICVVAGGVDMPYYDDPRSERLMEDVAAVGCILSENPPGTRHLGSLFARRNTILVGIAKGLFCVEAPKGSGALKVAELALEQGKDVFCVPANVGVKSAEGTNELLGQELARAAISGRRILEEYAYLLPQRREPVPNPAPESESTPPRKRPSGRHPAPEEPGASKFVPEKGLDTAHSNGYIEVLDTSDRWNETEKILLRAVAERALTQEALIAQTGLSASQIASHLVMLTVEGAVGQLPGGRYILRPEALRSN